jgi:hypothetical protein
MSVCRLILPVSKEYQLYLSNNVIPILEIPHSSTLKIHKFSEAESASVFNLKKEKEERTQVGQLERDNLNPPTSSKA